MTALKNIHELGLFTGIDQTENFANVKSTCVVREMPAAEVPYRWPRGTPSALPETFVDLDGVERSIAEFLVGSETTALLVLKDGEVRYEQYWLTGGADVQWVSMSIAKSWISALVGIAHAQRLIPDLDAPISDYIRVDPGSAYEGVPIRYVLRMASGSRFTEDYVNVPAGSDVDAVLAATAPPDGSLEDFVATRVRVAEPNTVCRYSSADTQALGQLLVKATGRSISDYMRESLVEPLGFEDPSYWFIDPQGMEAAFAGLNMTARDFARLGELYRLKGDWQGTRILPESWIADSTRPTTAAQQPGRVMMGETPLPLAYGYQWWLPPSLDGTFEAAGVYGQSIFVDPRRGVTIVRLAATRAYETEADEWSDYYVEMLEAIAASLD